MRILLKAFTDWDACFAVKHEGVLGDKTFGCLKYFCGWCLDPFQNSGSCHEHVKICRLNQKNHGGYFGSREDFLAVQAKVRADKVRKYLAANVTDAKERDALLLAMRKTDFEPVGIKDL